MIKCPECGSTDYSRERRLDGWTSCKSCGLNLKSSEWDARSEDPEPEDPEPEGLDLRIKDELVR